MRSIKGRIRLWVSGVEIGSWRVLGRAVDLERD